MKLLAGRSHRSNYEAATSPVAIHLLICRICTRKKYIRKLNLYRHFFDHDRSDKLKN